MLLIRQKHSGFAMAQNRFLDVREERAQRIKIPLLDGVKFMVMTLRTADCLPQPHGTDIAHPVGQHARLVILRLRPALLRRQQESIVSRRDFLFAGAARQKIAGQLFAGELIERLVVIERLDDVITIGPDVSRIIRMIAYGISESDHIQPAYRHPLAVLR